MITVCSITAGDAFKPFRDLTFPNKRDYCIRHNYHWWSYTRQLQTERGESWSKVLALMHIMDCVMAQHSMPDHWILWIDGDAVFTRMDYKPDDLLDPDADLVVSKDENGINFGVFLIRCCPASLDFLKAVWANPDALGPAQWMEQNAVHKLIAAHWPIRVKYADKSLMNAYPNDFRRGHSWIFHAPGNPKWPDRVGEIKRVLNGW